MLPEGSITMNKTSGSDGIPAELFQILKDDAVKALHSTRQEIWKMQQWPLACKSSVMIHTIKSFGVVNKAEIIFFWNSLAFSIYQQMFPI